MTSNSNIFSDRTLLLQMLLKNWCRRRRLVAIKCLQFVFTSFVCATVSSDSFIQIFKAIKRSHLCCFLSVARLSKISYKTTIVMRFLFSPSPRPFNSPRTRNKIMSFFVHTKNVLATPKENLKWILKLFTRGSFMHNFSFWWMSVARFLKVPPEELLGTA